MHLILLPSIPRKGVLFVKEYVNSSELSASPRYGRYEECPETVTRVYMQVQNKQHMTLPANTHQASSQAGTISTVSAWHCA